jgi:hypothetical protein
MSTTVIASGDTPPIFEFPKHIFDLVTLFIKLAAEFDFCFAVFLLSYHQHIPVSAKKFHGFWKVNNMLPIHDSYFALNLCHVVG